MKSSTLNTVIAITLVLLGVVLRVLPHPANFAPIAAIAIFGGAVLPRKLAVLVPLGAMILSDAVIGFHNLILVTWGCYAFIALMSHMMLKKRSITTTGVFAVSSSLLFFSVTNFAVWVWSGMYTHTLAGLSQCFILALPFFRNTLLSDIIYTAVLFGLYAFAVQMAGVVSQKNNTLSL